MSPDRYHVSAGSSLNRVRNDGAVVDVEGMERTHNDLGSVRGSAQLLDCSSQSLSHIDSVLPEHSIQLLFWQGTPVECDVCGVDSIAS